MTSLPRLKIADKVEQGVAFFMKNPLLAFESESDTFKRPDDIGYHRESLLLHEGSRKYHDRHPSTVAMTEPISKIFPMLRTCDIRGIAPLRTPLEPDDLFFVRVRSGKSKIGWLMHSGSVNIHLGDNNVATVIQGNPSLRADKQKMYWGAGKSGKIETSRDGPPVQQAVGFVNAVLGGQQLKPFEALSTCAQLFGEMPPVVPGTLRFYRRIVENPEFLFAFVALRREKVCDQKIYDAWIDTVGHHLKTLFPLIIRRYVGTVSDKAMLFRGNSFETFLVTTYIYRDAQFMSFVARFSPPKSEPVEYFLREFRNIRFSPLTKWLLNVIIMETKREFSEIDAPYYSISCILFLRVLASTVLGKSLEHADAMKEIANVFNLNPNASKSDIEQYKKLIDKYASFRSTKLRLRPALMTPFTIVKILMADVFASSQRLVDVAEAMNLGKTLDDYWHSLEEQNLTWP